MEQVPLTLLTAWPEVEMPVNNRKGLVPFTQLVKVRRGKLVLHFQVSHFHKTITRSSLAQNMSRKLPSGP